MNATEPQRVAPRRPFCLSAFICVHLWLILPLQSAADVQHGLRVPAGFDVSEFADSKLANDLYSLTVDPRGRLVVSGRGYVRILIDDDNDGRADRALEFADGPKDGAQGMLWEGDSLYVTGDGGLRRYRDVDGDGRADRSSELIRAMKTGGEHHAHDIKRGPDGRVYVLCGNSTEIDKGYATLPTSPVREPVAGCVLRFDADLKGSEIVAEGFRNAYRMDFSLDGELFTFDSDNERCVSLPWYEGMRFYHVLPGGHYGWLNPQRGQWWRMPPYYPDVIAPVADLGRGSPTGLVCYRHAQFPERYRGGFFLLDWTFGRVHFVSLEPSGSTYSGKPEVFLESVGDNGFAPTDAVVHPKTGDLFIAIGGRGTRGAVYRVRHPAGLKALEPTEVLKHQVKMPPRMRWGDHDTKHAVKTLALMRARSGQLSPELLEEFIRGEWDNSDRYVRLAVARLIAKLDQRSRLKLEAEAHAAHRRLVLYLGTNAENARRVIAGAGSLLADKDRSPDDRLCCVRAMQLALGDLISPQSKGTVWEGYSARAPLDPESSKAAAIALRSVFSSGSADLDRELSRTLAVLEDDDSSILARVAEQVTATSDPVEDIHYLIVLARLRGKRSEALTAHTANALLALDRKLTERRLHRDRHWPLRLAELHTELARKDPRLNGILLAHGEFGRPDHALFAQAPDFDRRRAAELFLARAQKDDDYPWDQTLVELVSCLPDEQCLPALRRLWDRGGLEEAILSVLARSPGARDRGRFLDGLRFPQVATVRLCLSALEKLPASAKGADVLPLVRALRGLPDGKEETRLRQWIGQLLQRATGQRLPADDKESWTAWFTRTYPDLAARLSGADGVDVAAWGKRLTALDWSAGDAKRGEGVYARASCSNCHSGGQALGPDLRGAASRFSRGDLFTTILQPSRDISPRYRTTLIETANGQIYQGMVIYEAVDSLILQTGPTTTVRLTNHQITSRRYTDTSLMPAGLIDKLTDREIADLYAYLKDLGRTR